MVLVSMMRKGRPAGPGGTMAYTRKKKEKKEGENISAKEELQEKTIPSITESDNHSFHL